MSDPRNRYQKRQDANWRNTVTRLKKAEDKILTDLRNGIPVKDAQKRLAKIRKTIYGIEF